MIQTFSLEKVLNKFGTRGERAVTKFLTQLNYMQKCFPLDTRTINKDQWVEALRKLMFLVEKHKDDINSRGCVDVKRQYRREVHKKEDVT